MLLYRVLIMPICLGDGSTSNSVGVTPAVCSTEKFGPQEVVGFVSIYRNFMLWVNTSHCIDSTGRINARDYVRPCSIVMTVKLADLVTSNLNNRNIETQFTDTIPFPRRPMYINYYILPTA